MRSLSAVVSLVALGACASTAGPDASAPAGGGLSAEVRRTAYGVPHVKADSYGGLGYGIGFASAEDNICDLAERIVTVSGQRARFFGPGRNDENIISDIYHGNLVRSGEVERLLEGPSGSIDTPSAEARALISGFAEGVNRYLSETGVSAIPDERCKGAIWVRPITEIDYWRTVFAGQVPLQVAGIAGAAPPDQGPARIAARDDLLTETIGHGSNAYGLGRETTRTGRGVLLANPHYPWDGINRFYRMHLTIPGRLNVVGAGLLNSPIIGIGHTEHIAWTHTVSTARRFGYFEMKLDPTDPTRYLYDGASWPMTRASISVEVKDGLSSRTVERQLFSTHLGPVVETETLPWTKERAFVLAQPPLGLRIVDQYIDLWQAKSVADMRVSLGRYQATGFNTTAADSSGMTFFGDMGMIPHVSAAHAETCTVSDLAREMWTRQRIPTLDGSRSECAWRTDPDSSAPGVFGASAAPQLMRADYASQSNDSHWLTNARQPLEGYSPIFGDERTARSLRTRLGLDIIAQRQAGADGLPGKGFDKETLKASIYNNRHLGAELVRDDLVSLCRASGKANLSAACTALAGWDLRVNLDSRGAHLFHLFAEAGGLQFRTPFDPSQPETTPRDLKTDDPRVLAALEKAVAQLAELGIAPDAPLASVQVETRGEERIPIHGGAGPEGVFNVITVEDLKPQLGWTSIRHGASFIMAVEFTENGPVSEGVLSYSQSTNPVSPHHSDQTRLYSQKGWDDLRFTEKAVLEGAVTVRRLRQ